MCKALSSLNRRKPWRRHRAAGGGAAAEAERDQQSHDPDAGDVRRLLPPRRASVLDRAQPPLPVHEREAPRGLGAPRLRRLGRRLRAAHRRDRHRQDDVVPLPAGAASRELRRRRHLQPQALRERDARRHLRRVRAGLSGGRVGRRAQHQDLCRHPQRLSARPPRRGTHRRPRPRRGAEPDPRRARADAAFDQPGDQRRKAVADRHDRPARAQDHAGAAGAEATGAADHRPISPRGTDPGGEPRVRPPPAAPRRRAGLAVSEGRAVAALPAQRRRSQADQRDLRPGAARRLRPGRERGDPADGEEGGRGGVRPARGAADARPAGWFSGSPRR